MKNSFSLRHIGVNTADAQQAEQLANLLSAMFNLEPRMGNKSVFAGSIVECMKSPYLGAHGHIALETADLESAVEELKEKGFTFNTDTAQYTEAGGLKNIYLNGEYGGFAIHIMQK